MVEYFAPYTAGYGQPATTAGQQVGFDPYGQPQPGMVPQPGYGQAGFDPYGQPQPGYGQAGFDPYAAGRFPLVEYTPAYVPAGFDPYTAASFPWVPAAVPQPGYGQVGFGPYGQPQPGLVPQVGTPQPLLWSILTRTVPRILRSVRSDVYAKANMELVNERETLDRLVKIPISTWNYWGEYSSTRHIGPMAQDFNAAFGVGADDKHIDAVDANGVALAAIKALYRIVQEQQIQIRQAPLSVRSYFSEFLKLGQVFSHCQGKNR